jgi:hypothetical protein
MHGDYKYICNIARHQVEVTLRHIIDQLQSGPMKPGWDDG